MRTATQQTLRLRPQFFAATSAASFSATHLHHVLTRGCASEEMVVSDDTMHLGARQVHAFGNQWHGVGRNKAQCILNRMQQRQQAARLRLMVGQELANQQEFRRCKGLVHKSIS